MPRRDRCILPGVACHVTQRGVDRGETFSAAADRETYLSLMRQNLQDAGVGLLAWCLMTNHIHLIALPERGDTLRCCCDGSTGDTPSITMRGMGEAAISGKTAISPARLVRATCGRRWRMWN